MWSYVTSTTHGRSIQGSGRGRWGIGFSDIYVFLYTSQIECPPNGLEHAINVQDMKLAVMRYEANEEVRYF